MNKPDRSTLALAQYIHGRVTHLRDQSLCQIDTQVDCVISTLDNLRTLQKHLRVCRLRQWQAAAARVQQQITWTLDQIPTEVAASINAIKQRRPNLPTLRQVLEDLDQLRHEFGEYDFDDQAVAEFFEQQVDQGRKPEQFARLWIHSHPGSSPHPSLTDDDTFRRVFGTCHWAVMFIIARDGTSYARLRFNIGPGGEMTLPVRVDYSQPFAASDHAAWKQEYLAKVQPERWQCRPDRPAL